MDTVGTVTALHVAPGKGEQPEATECVRAVASRGLRGDRYFAADGTFRDRDGSDLTVVAAEALDALADETGIELADGTHRRNVTTMGVDLETLVDRQFRIGDAVCVGTGPCTPCAYLESHIDEAGLREAMTDRGGLRARIVESGIIRTGDTVAVSSTDGHHREY